MRLNFQLLLFLSTIAVAVRAQSDQFSLLNIGDQAPTLRVRDWIKGEPVQRFEKGHVYVLEFWEPGVNLVLQQCLIFPS